MRRAARTAPCAQPRSSNRPATSCQRLGPLATRRRRELTQEHKRPATCVATNMMTVGTPRRDASAFLACICQLRRQTLQRSQRHALCARQRSQEVAHFSTLLTHALSRVRRAALAPAPGVRTPAPSRGRAQAATKWIMAAICACGVLGAGLAVVAARSTGAALAQAVGVQAAYVCALAVILLRMSGALRNALSPHLPAAGALSTTSALAH